MSVLATAARIIRQRGETMALERAGTTSIDVKAKRYGESVTEVAGSMVDASFFVKITNEEIAASTEPRAPRRGDTIGGYIITSVDTRRDSGSVAIHILAVGGGQ